jgi:hypothetical protein
MEYNYITLGNDCSTSSALKNLGLRSKSLPFDWIISDMDKIIECINEDFSNFHKNLRLNQTKTKIIDHYGFEYPHDYPNSDVVDIEVVGDGQFNENLINDNWEDFIELNLEKYSRRIKRFIDILNSEKDLIVLYRGSLSNLEKFRSAIKVKFNKDNIKYVVATGEVFENDYLVTCNPEINGISNDISIWEEAMIKIKSKK